MTTRPHRIPQMVDAERKASDVLNDIRKSLDGISEDVESIRSITSGSAKKIEDVAQNIDLMGLPVAEGAEFGNYMGQREEECLQGTREDLLHKVKEWAVLPEGKSMFWLNGLAGTGKSTISRTVARNFQKQGLLGASFLFKRGEGDRGNAARFFPTIARQLLTGIPELRNAIQQMSAKVTMTFKLFYNNCHAPFAFDFSLPADLNCLSDWASGQLKTVTRI
ncbi:WD repeat protein [Talaromyces pinophilus]|uniref:WD repeat protein n=1 Tax=Talaromyces pinophilus TaxID=128442 RepID=A0A478EA51_TALPI|nr:WD repeat protein [Talaromyces pinophilus]